MIYYLLHLDLDLFGLSLGLELGVGHTHEVTVGHVAEGVASRAHLLVHLHSMVEIETSRITNNGENGKRITW